MFAIAFTTHIVNGLDVGSAKFDIKLMREHLIKCLEKSKMTPFPLSKGSKVKYCKSEQLIIDVYSICNSVYDPSIPMVACDICNKWCHGACVIKNPQELQGVLAPTNENYWVCAQCKLDL